MKRPCQRGIPAAQGGAGHVERYIRICGELKQLFEGCFCFLVWLLLSPSHFWVPFYCRRCLKGFSKPLLKSNTPSLDTTWTTSTRSFKCSRIGMKIKQFFVAEREWPFSHFPLAFYFIFLSTLFYNRPSA